ncbi:MAG: phosphomannomutase/phosphoglucomutase [Ramlibacter sp.]
MQIHPGLFKAYDLRGAVPGMLDARVTEAVGLAFARMALAEGEHGVVVGRDGRLSGPELAAALIRGLLAGGLDVIDIGQATTPMAWFAGCTLAQSAAQVTASHNPRDDNGLKLMLRQRNLHGADLRALREAVEAGPQPATVPGRLRTADITAGYLARIATGVRLARPMKVVLDCGNGVAGATSPEVLRALGCEVVELFTEVDGRFPNHHPDPSRPENLRDLVAAVRASGAELGLALDGDGDRLGVVTASGHVVFPDRQLILFAQDVLARHPGAPVVFDVKCTQRLPEAIAAAGGRPVMVASGYPQMKARALELDAPLSGEMSGHVIFRDRWYGFDDGTYAAARLLEILSRHADAGAVLEALPASCSTPELQVRCAEGEAHQVAARLVEIADVPDAQVTSIDGLRVDWPDGFGLVRASNTTPVLVLRFEGNTSEAQARIQEEMLALLPRVKPDALLR